VPPPPGGPGGPGGEPPPGPWNSLAELEHAAITDKDAAHVLSGYHNWSGERLLAAEAAGDRVATGMLNRRYGGRSRPYLPFRPIDPALRERLRTEVARIRERVEAQREQLRAEQERLRAAGEPTEPDDRLEPGPPPKWDRPRPRFPDERIVPTGKQLHRYRGTIAAGVSDIPAFEGEVFEGGSPRAFGTYDPAHPVRPPETITDLRGHGHAEQAIGQQIHDRLAALPADQRAAASGGTIWIHVDQEVCSTCGAGLGAGDRSGVLLRLSELNPDILFVITAEDTMQVIRLRAGVQVP